MYEGISLTLLISLTVIFNNNNNNNTYLVPVSILLFSSRVHKVYMHKVHEPTKKISNNFVNTKTIKIT